MTVDSSVLLVYDTAIKHLVKPTNSNFRFSHGLDLLIQDFAVGVIKGDTKEFDAKLPLENLATQQNLWL